MPYELRRITPAALEDVVHVMNGSSEGHSFQFQLDAMQFLSLSRLWNFSYAHSYLGYIDGKPAGIVLNAIDKTALETYSFYWGVLPQFRGHRMSMALAFRYLDQVQQEGFLRAFADASADSPHSIYERLGYHHVDKLIELRTSKPEVRVSKPNAIIRSLSTGEFLSLGIYNQGHDAYWTRRPQFVQNADRFLQILGSCGASGVEAYAIVTNWPGYTVIYDCRSMSGSDEPAYHIIQFLIENDYPPPFVACYLPEGGRGVRLFEGAGFGSSRAFVSLRLDLTTRRMRHA